MLKKIIKHSEITPFLLLNMFPISILFKRDKPLKIVLLV